MRSSETDSGADRQKLSMVGASVPPRTPVFGIYYVGRVNEVRPDVTSLHPGQLILCDYVVRLRDAPKSRMVLGSFSGCCKTWWARLLAYQLPHQDITADKLLRSSSCPPITEGMVSSPSSSSSPPRMSTQYRRSLSPIAVSRQTSSPKLPASCPPWVPPTP